LLAKDVGLLDVDEHVVGLGCGGRLGFALDVRLLVEIVVRLLQTKCKILLHSPQLQIVNHRIPCDELLSILLLNHQSWCHYFSSILLQSI